MKKEREFITWHVPECPGQSIVQVLCDYHLIFCSNYPSINREMAMICAGDVQSVRYEDDGFGFT